MLLICLRAVRSKLIKTEKKLRFEMTGARAAYDQVGEVVHDNSNATISIQDSSTYEEAQKS